MYIYSDNEGVLSWVRVIMGGGGGLSRGRVVYNLWHQVAEIMLGPRSCRVHNLCATCAQPVRNLC
jgi:hypothetical protein